MLVEPLFDKDVLSDSMLIAQLNERALNDVHEVAQRIAHRIERLMERSALLDLFAKTEDVLQQFQCISRDLRCAMYEAGTIQGACRLEQASRIM